MVFSTRPRNASLLCTFSDISHFPLWIFFAVSHFLFALIFRYLLPCLLYYSCIHRPFFIYRPSPCKNFSKQSRCRAPPGQAALPSQPSRPLLGQPKPALLRNYLLRRQHPFRSRLPRNANCRNSKTSTMETNRRQLRKKAHPRKLCDWMNYLSPHHAAATMSRPRKLHPRRPRVGPRVGGLPLSRRRPRHPQPLQSNGP